MLVATATPLRRPTRRTPFPRSKLSDPVVAASWRGRTFSTTTKYSGGMYSHADHIWTNGIFYFLFPFPQHWYLPLGTGIGTAFFWKHGNRNGHVDTHWVGSIVGETTNLNLSSLDNGVKLFLGGENEILCIPSITWMNGQLSQELGGCVRID